MAKVKQDPKLRAWLNGWNRGSSGAPGAMPRTNADEYDRGYRSGWEARRDGAALAGARLHLTQDEILACLRGTT